jgi:hypothetical protein
MCPVTVAPPDPPSPRARRIATPSWLDVRLVAGIVLVLGAVLIGAKVVSSARHTYPVVASRHRLAAGTVLTADDVTLARVQLPGHGSGVYLSRLPDAVGKRLGRDVSAGELVPADALAAAAASTTVTVPLAVGAAPDLRKGQRIEVWVSTKTCASLVLLPDVPVQAVHAGGGSYGSDDGQDVVISVAPPLADRVVQALALPDVKLRAGVLSGPRTEQTAATLPDLAGCAPPTATR